VPTRLMCGEIFRVLLELFIVISTVGLLGLFIENNVTMMQSRT